MPELHLVAGSEVDRETGGEVRSIAINRLPCILGRAPGCDHRIDNPLISRRHCALSYREGQLWVEDLASRNGTRLDGEPVLAPRPVENGATLQLAGLSFVVRQDDSLMESTLKPDRLAGTRTWKLGRIS
jgi:pSer/pThr/pTyr-binding forkhead associated (FHA) protein